MIDCFMHEFAFLSNYARILPESPVTVEHLYQAAKAAFPEDAARIMAAEALGDEELCEEKSDNFFTQFSILCDRIDKNPLYRCLKGCIPAPQMKILLSAAK